jgi:pilus assembly protein CpaB
MILLVVAVGCGLVASYMTQQLLANREKEVPTVKVLVAKKRIASYTNIKDPEALFVEKEFPENVAPKKAVSSFAEAKDKRTNKALAEEAVLLLDDLADAKTEGLAASMGPGERAVSIRVNAEKSVAGFVLPGSRVDVVATMNADGASGKESKIILQNMLVLAVDTQAEKDPEKRSILGQTVTLSAKPEEAEKLALAQSLGELQLILRAFGDKEVVHVKQVRRGDLDRPHSPDNSSDKEEEPTRAAAAPPVPVLPPVVAAGPEEKPAPVVEAPPEKRYETHTLTIQNGENQQKAIFTREEGQKTWSNGQVGKVPDEALQAQSQPKRGPAKPPAGKAGN